MSKIYLSPPHLSGRELESVAEAIASNYLAPGGPKTELFESRFAEYVEIPYTLAVTSGTAALHLALRVLGVGPGDEVFASTLTHIGSINPICYLGARPVFIDVDPQTWTMDSGLLAAELARSAQRGKSPSVVLPTDLFGLCTNLEEMERVCTPFGVPIVSDCAQSIGSSYRGRHAGFGAKVAAYSFNGNKIITTSGGGMLASSDETLIDRARFLAHQSKADPAYYVHTEIGYSYRMSNILAAIGVAQLEVLEERVEAKRTIFETYRALLRDQPGITFMPDSDWGRPNRWLTVILISEQEFGANRDNVLQALLEAEIESRPVFKPMHLQRPFAQCRVRGGAVSEKLFESGLCLPSGTGLSRVQIERVVEVVKTCGRG
jgi:dTDP-4-amino-4,6-dideoxygalactose transaminase